MFERKVIVTSDSLEELEEMGRVDVVFEVEPTKEELTKELTEMDSVDLAEIAIDALTSLEGNRLQEFCQNTRPFFEAFRALSPDKRENIVALFHAIAETTRIVNADETKIESDIMRGNFD